jgi:hypothetical protein
MSYFELTPAYGRDYKKKADVIADFEKNKDFEGDHQLGFRIVNKQDLDLAMRNGPYTVLLRYKKNTMVAAYKVSK